MTALHDRDSHDQDPSSDTAAHAECRRLAAHARLRDELVSHRLEGTVTPELTAALVAFASICRDAGDSAERVLLALKALIREVREISAHVQPPPRFDRERAFTQDLIGACIACYYNGPRSDR